MLVLSSILSMLAHTGATDFDNIADLHNEIVGHQESENHNTSITSSIDEPIPSIVEDQDLINNNPSSFYDDMDVIDDTGKGTSDYRPDTPSLSDMKIPPEAINIHLHNDHATYDIDKNGKTCHGTKSYDLEHSSEYCDV